MAEKSDHEEISCNNIHDNRMARVVKEDGEALKLLWGFTVKEMMMKELPSDWVIMKEAKEAMRECTTKFISFVTTQANVKCKKEKRVILSGDDVSWALQLLGFADILDPPPP